jgi:hypothetical protein
MKGIQNLNALIKSFSVSSFLSSRNTTSAVFQKNIMKRAFQLSLDVGGIPTKADKGIWKCLKSG